MDIRKALDELPEEDAARIALDFLRDCGYAVKMWTRADLVSKVEDDFEWDDLSDEQREKAIDFAFGTTSFGRLEDCTDEDWDWVDMALEDGYRAVKGL